VRRRRSITPAIGTGRAAAAGWLRPVRLRVEGVFVHRTIRIVAVSLAICISLLLSPTAQAQVAPLGYPPGWNLAGGPAGMDLAGAEGLFVYHAGVYAPATGMTTSACTGYWAYFSTPAAANLPATEKTAQTCPLEAGWSLVGNPFDDEAAMPAGTVALGWDAGTQAYTPARTIPVGHAVWVWSPTGGSIALTSVAAGGVTISAPSPPEQPVHLHVGQYLTVLVPLGSTGATFVAHTVVPHLTFIDGNPVPGTSKYAYRWQAASAGEADITLDPACLAAGCAQPSFVIRVTVIP